MFIGIYWAVLSLVGLFLIGLFIGKKINAKIYLTLAIIGFLGGMIESSLDKKESEERYEYRHSISGAKDEINTFINGYKNCILESKRGNNSDKRLDDRRQCYNYYSSEMNPSYWRRKFSERDFSDSELNQLMNYFDNQWESQITDNPDLD